ncbi:protein OSB2 chloroplastic-like isoform X2 [Tripterygium wilfordii]|uniref:Protein OSB2 chloroplastic-like isoform X2 n=1 Tax=Tripterygium wilfordii TaxID=458696 RepID=A0A7J7D6C5_TRIWF|nr:protein OSB2, chloroplastic-like [Tripterygium wilfordii]KAF5741861.1 protein OSB2 chloroplastic-like isoform X2 [Tripterygium wilfordii]
MVAIEQALVLRRSLSIGLPRIPITNNQISHLSANPFASSNRSCSYSPAQINKRVRFNRRLKCSFDYNQVSYPKPPEIPWKKELCNSVELIGIVGIPVEIKHLPSGKVLAWTRLGVRKSASDTSWISLTFWDEMAHVAFQHIEKGHQIYVSGRLVSDTVENEDGRQLTYYKVVVHQLNFIEKSFSPLSLNDRDSNSIAPDRRIQNSAANSFGSSSIEELWQAFFANPVDWWDNRNSKRNPKYPDFKHKDTGEALWVEGRNNPHWVKSQLEILDSRMGSLHDQDSRMYANDLMPL